MRFYTLILVLLFTFPIFSIEETLVLETPTVFFSPNFDDINDTMILSIKYSGSRVPVDWRIHIADESGKVIKVFSADLRHKRKKGFYFFIGAVFFNSNIFLHTTHSFLGVPHRRGWEFY